MTQNTLILVRVDDSLKKDADALFFDSGLDTPTAIRIFLKLAIMRQGLPFEVTQAYPNVMTVAAMEEAERMSHNSRTKKYSNFSELLEEIKNEI